MLLAVPRPTWSLICPRGSVCWKNADFSRRAIAFPGRWHGLKQLAYSLCLLRVSDTVHFVSSVPRIPPHPKLRTHLLTELWALL